MAWLRSLEPPQTEGDVDMLRAADGEPVGQTPVPSVGIRVAGQGPAVIGV